MSMKDYIEESIEESIGKFLEDLGESCSSIAVDHLFKVNKQGVSLDEKKVQQFQTTIARMLLVCKRERPNIQPTIVFLTTRVRQPDKNNWKKLCWLLKYLREQSTWCQAYLQTTSM
eukprot:6882042-Ditylum_brightwellii.AAC.1